ncbi:MULTISPECIES: hypothetical protein [Actinomadura]|uniref:ROS/MUCR transcriptional regulator protein n=1 Tax=Actinomadura yumaensis TaxID=111807 RepID=A0ABW2CU17_9ACTN|nr:hypothetical protein [Actinomadura sp. J1-007]MWK39557.1 hypothetical protein [Actinomadura sp. J1-007]
MDPTPARTVAHTARHAARLDTSPDATAPVCGVCGRPVTGTGAQLRHAGEARRPQLVPARGDLAAVRRAELIAQRALTGVTWTPHTTDADRAAAVVEALYAAGLIAARPRTVRPRPPGGAGQPTGSPTAPAPSAAAAVRRSRAIVA